MGDGAERMRIRTVRGVLLLSLLIAMGGCTRWKVVPTPPPHAEAPRTYSRARVTPMERGIVVLHDVRITADSVTGWRKLPTGYQERIALHRTQVRIFERRALNPLPNALIGAAVVYVVGVWFFATCDAC